MTVFYLSTDRCITALILSPTNRPAAISTFKAFVLQNQREQHNESLHNHVRIVERPSPTLKPGEIHVKINVAGFNHREVCSAFAQKWEGAAVTFL